jgi:8-oxo-dGTP pyrophosphatase MutT (NUDIX family)
MLHSIARCYWRITGPMTVGVRILLVCDASVLLVKHTYQDSWHLPGGGVKKRETLSRAIRREVEEEVGARISNFKLFNVYSNFYEGKNDHIALFIFDGPVEMPTHSKTREIESVEWFPMDELPEKVSPGTRRRISEYLTSTSSPGCEW